MLSAAAAEAAAAEAAAAAALRWAFLDEVTEGGRFELATLQSRRPAAGGKLEEVFLFFSKQKILKNCLNVGNLLGKLVF